ncbi:energy transducer TonB [Lysobacter koreensis]|uniref:energy transducer TonB n=1 Tax=Lysobacter koreensis TaxID=266122 RepID=UPI0036DEDD31
MRGAGWHRSGWAAAALAMLVACSGPQPAPGPSPIPATDPVAQDTPPPDYPLEVACAGVGGVVELHILLGANGTPGDIRIGRSSGQPLLDAAAREGVRSWRFRAATRGGQPVATRMKIPVTFTPPTMRPERCFVLDEQLKRAR